MLSRAPAAIARLSALVALMLVVGGCGPSGGPGVARAPGEVESLRRAYVEFRLASQPLAVLTPRVQADGEFERFRQTQRAFIKSSSLIALAALRGIDVSKTELLRDREDAARWLQEALRVTFPRDGEIMSIALPHPSAPEDELKRLVEAVGQAYREEVVFRQRQEAAMRGQIVSVALGGLRDRIARLAAIDAEQNGSPDGELSEDEAPPRIEPVERRELETLLLLERDLVLRRERLKVEALGPPRVSVLGAKGDGNPLAAFDSGKE